MAMKKAVRTEKRATRSHLPADVRKAFRGVREVLQPEAFT